MRGVIHDINNVLAVVLGAANAMIERAAAGASELDGHMRDHLADIVAAAERGRTMLRTALAPAEAVDAPPAAVPLDDTIRALHGNLRHLCGAVMELRLDLAAPGLHVRADRETLERVLLNLVANARDAVADGGIVTLRSAAPADASDGYAVVTIHDTGAGIPPAVLARLGERFFTTKPPDHGTGLGLATVRRLLDAVGGSFVIDSAVGQGTTVRLLLKLANAPEATAPLPDAPRARGGRRTVLLVEDDAMLRRLVAGALARRGWHVVQAGSAEAAIEHLGEASPADIGALVADLSLPGQPGDRLGLEVRARLGRPCLPVILVSGFPAANGGAAADSAMGFLAKPYATTDLAALIAALVRAEALEQDPGVGPIR